MNLLSPPAPRILSQGTIFTCARAEDYEGCEVYGMIITARCDIANDKVMTYNYLPVVCMDDWIHRDGKTIICYRARREVGNALRSLLKTLGYSPSILTTEAPRRIFEVLFGSTDGKQKGQRTKWEQYCELIELITAADASTPSERQIVTVATQFDKIRAAILDELVRQKLSGYYFLPAVETEALQSGYVVLLREIRHMPRLLAARVAAGLGPDEYAELAQAMPSCATRLDLKAAGFSMPISTVASPHLEHLMQTFSLLFTRIGLPDPPDDYVSALWSRQPSVGGCRD